MYEVFADKGIDIIGEDDSMNEHDDIDDEDAAYRKASISMTRSACT